jgi:hypothetical protein
MKLYRRSILYIIVDKIGEKGSENIPILLRNQQQKNPCGESSPSHPPPPPKKKKKKILYLGMMFVKKGRE